ncbi:hypothetical protein HID58_000930, partial [Brassica napus]
TRQHNNPRPTHGPTTKPSKKKNGSSAVIFFSTCNEKKKMESTRVKNSKHLLQTTAVRFKPELSVHRRRSTRQNSNCRGHVLLYGEPTTNLHRRELFQLDLPNILTSHQIDASKLIQSSTIHPTSNRDVRRETVERVTNGSPPSPSNTTRKTKPDNSVKVNASRQKQKSDILVKPTEIYQSQQSPKKNGDGQSFISFFSS